MSYRKALRQVTFRLKQFARNSIPAESKRIRLVVTDIEGCLNLDERTYDYEALTWIRQANQVARVDNVVPFVTVSSGRQCAFVEVIVRMIAGRMPAIFENGCGLFFPTHGVLDECKWHPSLGQSSTASNHAKVLEIAKRVCVRTGARLVMGKEILVSIRPPLTMNVDELYTIISRALDEDGIVSTISYSASAVDIAPAGIDKGSGLKWLVSELAQEFSLELADVAGIGDSAGDLPLLRLVGFSTAPSNATEEVRNMVSYCSTNTNGQGVMDIVQRCVAVNLGSKEGT